MRGFTFRSALAAMAIAAAVLGSAGTASASPSGPCADVPYVGVCEPVRSGQTDQPRQSMGEVVVPGVGNDPQLLG
jgi:hypothetical protein